jgi:hypothetical protein
MSKYTKLVNSKEKKNYDSISHHSITLGEVMAAKRKRDVNQLRKKEGRKPTK